MKKTTQPKTIDVPRGFQNNKNETYFLLKLFRRYDREITHKFQ